MRWLIIFISLLICLPVFGQTASENHQESKTVEELFELSENNLANNPKQARAYAEQVIALARETKNDTTEIKGLYQLGSIDLRQGNSTAARTYFETGLEKSKEIGSTALTGEGFYHLSKIYETESHYDEAITYLNDALNLFKELQLNAEIAKCYFSLGNIYIDVGSYSRALTNLFQSLSINEELDLKKWISIVKSDIGIVYLNTSKHNEARRYFTEALAIDRAINYREGIIINTLNVGVAEQKMGSFDEALKIYRKGLVMAREHESLIDEAFLLQNIGSTLRQKGNFEEGLTNLFASLKLRKKIDINTSHTLNDISETYLDLQDLSNAKEYSLLAIESSKKWNDRHQLWYAHLVLADIYNRLGDFRNAYQTLSQSNSIKDSLFTVEKARQMDELGVIYETEKKEQEIELLTLQTQTAEFRRNAYLAGGLLATFILLLLYYGQRQKNKKNRQLLEKEQEVAEMKSNFFSNISHEFRTPLTLISGPIEMLKEDIGDESMRSQLDIMEKNADRLLSLINQLLDLSKLESGKLELSKESTDMVMLTRGVAMTFQSLADMKNINLSVETELASLVLDADREKVETILINLINNAFAYTPEGEKVTVSLGIDEGENDNPQCSIRVKDTGQGIPEKDLPRVFDRFYRGDSESGQQKIGTGIGLALTKELVELHGGSIEVSSTVNLGTEFVVMLPGENLTFKKASTDKVEVTNSSTPEALEPTNKIISDEGVESELQESSDPILLLIEDNEDVTNYLKDILGNTYRVIEASDGEQGVEAALEHIPDLIISDVMMPKMDGYQVAETLKQDQKTSHIPLILLTAKADQKDKMQGLRAHADEYLTKPFRPEELRIRIQNLIESRRQLREKYKREFMLRPDKVEVHSMDEAFLLRVREAVDRHINDEDFTVEQLGREVGMSRSQLHRKLTALIDQSATEFIRSYRLHRAKEMISREAGSISEISYAVGFGSPSYFSKCFREEFGYSPSETGKQLS